MKDNSILEGIKKQELNLLFVIDNSGSMEGEKLGAVNNAIRDVMSIMPEIQEDTSDAEIKISALTFSENCRWVYSEPKGVSDFKWSDITAEGGTDYSKAYDELAKFLCKRENGGKMPDAVGIPEDQLRKAASMAVCKINIDSDLRLAVTAGVRKHMVDHPDHFDPRQYMTDARNNCRELVKHKIIDVLGSQDKK